MTRIPCATALISAGLCLAATATADINITFVESAPKDWFSISNSGGCTIGEIVATFDLRETSGKLIFDTTAAGAGVEVFQPFAVRQGNISLVNTERVEDGATSLTVLVKSLEPGTQASFTIDVDDTLKDSELGMIRVTDAEISGGAVSLNIDQTTVVKGRFDANGEISLTSPDCPESG